MLKMNTRPVKKMAKLHLKIIFLDMPPQDILTAVFQATPPPKIKEKILSVKLNY